MDTKLILIEGLPGSGKSTTARLVQEVLMQNVIESELFCEGDLNHPADYESVAYYENDQWHRLLEDYSAFRDQIFENCIPEGNGYLLRYKKLGPDIPDIFYEKVYKNDIYELPLDQNMKLIINNWERFSKRAASGKKVHIFECCFIQNPVTVGMIKYGAPLTKVRNYVLALEKSVKNLNPILIYISQDNLDFSFKKAIIERPQSWSDGFIHYYTDQGYGKKNLLSGAEGTLKVLKARRQAEEEILKELSIRKAVINNSAFDANSHKAALEKLLINHPEKKGKN
ncbi:hypothetical protein [Cytobacillus sp. BC1816]|uniref:hypothetical protein n=1 Tax=Cytobacillus sp. BC1816 TaxID=3440154 RepID=UPI003F515240